MKRGAQRCRTTVFLLFIWICFVAGTEGLSHEKKCSKNYRSSFIKIREAKSGDNMGNLRRRRNNELDDWPGGEEVLVAGDMKKYNVIETLKKVGKNAAQNGHRCIRKCKRRKLPNCVCFNSKDESGVNVKGFILKASGQQLENNPLKDAFNSDQCQPETFENDEPNIEDYQMLKRGDGPVVKASFTKLPIKVFSSISETAQGDSGKKPPVINLQVVKDQVNNVVPVPCQKPTEFSLFTTTKKGCPELIIFTPDCPSTCPTTCSEMCRTCPEQTTVHCCHSILKCGCQTTKCTGGCKKNICKTTPSSQTSNPCADSTQRTKATCSCKTTPRDSCSLTSPKCSTKNPCQPTPSCQTATSCPQSTRACSKPCQTTNQCQTTNKCQTANQCQTKPSSTPSRCSSKCESTTNQCAKPKCSTACSCQSTCSPSIDCKVRPKSYSTEPPTSTDPYR